MNITHEHNFYRIPKPLLIMGLTRLRATLTAERFVKGIYIQKEMEKPYNINLDLYRKWGGEFDCGCLLGHVVMASIHTLENNTDILPVCPIRFSPKNLAFNEVMKLIVRKALKGTYDAYNFSNDIVEFNDHKNTTLEDVHKVIDKAIYLVEQVNEDEILYTRFCGCGSCAEAGGLPASTPILPQFSGADEAKLSGAVCSTISSEEGGTGQGELGAGFDP